MKRESDNSTITEHWGSKVENNISIQILCKYLF